MFAEGFLLGMLLGFGLILVIVGIILILTW